ncbi:hypothetical protein HaLaN_26345, partial [Haematococcus lacustris]
MVTNINYDDKSWLARRMCLKDAVQGLAPMSDSDDKYIWHGLVKLDLRWKTAAASRVLEGAYRRKHGGKVVDIKKLETANTAKLDLVYDRLQQLWDIVRGKEGEEKEESHVPEVEDPTLKKGPDTEWQLPKYQDKQVHVWQPGQEKEFKATVRSDGFAVMKVGEEFMPSRMELWALLELTMSYADIIFKEGAIN